MGGAAGRHRASSAFPPTRSGLNAAGQAPGRSIAVYRRGAGKRPGPLPCPGEASGRAGGVRTSAAPAAVLPRSAPAPLAAARGRQRAAARGGARRGGRSPHGVAAGDGTGASATVTPPHPLARAAWGTAHLRGEFRGLLQTSGGPGGSSGAAGLALGRPRRCSAAAPGMGRQAAAVGEQGEENWALSPRV